MTDRERWGTILRDARRNRLFLTQGEFAARVTELAAEAGTDLAVDQSTVSRWESGESAPALKMRPYIAQALGVDPSMLFQEAAA